MFWFFKKLNFSKIIIAQKTLKCSKKESEVLSLFTNKNPSSQKITENSPFKNELNNDMF